MTTQITAVTTYAGLTAITGMVHGDIAIWYDLTMQYDGVVGDWVPAQVFGRGPQNIAKIVGNSATPAGWTVTTTGSGTVTTDGTKVTASGLGASTDTAYLENVYDVPGEKMGVWVQGRFQAGTPDASATDFKNFNRITNRDGTRDRSFTLQVGTADQSARFHNATTGLPNAAGSFVTSDIVDFSSAEHFLVIIWRTFEPGTNPRDDIAYVNGRLQCRNFGTSGYVSGSFTDSILIGDDTATANQGGSIIMRNVISGTFHSEDFPYTDW